MWRSLHDYCREGSLSLLLPRQTVPPLYLAVGVDGPNAVGGALFTGWRGSWQPKVAVQSWWVGEC